jgi:non-haem dioxygenase in morphine synthesis N-terminal
MPGQVKSQLAQLWAQKDPTLNPKDYPIRPYARPPLTTAKDIKYAPLVEIDFSHWDEPGEKQRLADQLHATVRDVGFYIVKGHGISDEEILEILGIANTLFHEVPLEVKRSNPIDLHAGQSFGYREPTRYYGDTGIRETLETVPHHTPVFWSRLTR